MENKKEAPVFDYDYIVIGSGFGGSVSAMRLSQKGYKVAVIESGKRFKDEDFAKTNYSVNKFLWLPSLFCYGIQRLDLLSHVMIMSGAGVGGGSLVYANTLYIPPKKVFETSIVQKMGGESKILPFYEIAKKMLGVRDNPRTDIVDDFMKQTAEQFGMGNTFQTTPVGVNFGKENDNIDPFFGGEGPIRKECTFCGACMIGCRENAKNTLEKNYLYFAEKNGTTIIPETKVVKIIPLSEDGEAGYEIHTKSTTGWFGNPKKVFRTKGVVLSAAVLGTVSLMLKMKEQGHLKRISSKIGHLVRTNSESILGVTTQRNDLDFSKGVAITSSVYPDDHTHIEPCRYPDGSDLMNSMASGVLVRGGGNIPRQLRFLWEMLKHPYRSIRYMLPMGFAKKSIILLVMQAVDNSIEIIRKRRWFWPFTKSLSSIQEHGEPIPTYIPIANEFAKKLSKNISGIARSSINEVLLDVPMTAHILGGCVIGETEKDGVVDLQNRVFGYKNFIVCDGSMVPVNLGVNPSLTITALSERAMSFVPPKDGNNQKFFEFEKKWNVTKILENK